MKSSQKLGEAGEEIAVEYLTKKGYQIVEQNYRCRNGEIDVIAKDQDMIVFVEVKTRRSLRFGIPQAAVTHKKQVQISTVALNYLYEKDALNSSCRFDVVAITLPPASEKLNVVHIKNAFEYQEKEDKIKA